MKNYIYATSFLVVLLIGFEGVRSQEAGEKSDSAKDGISIGDKLANLYLIGARVCFLVDEQEKLITISTAHNADSKSDELPNMIEHDHIYTIFDALVPANSRGSKLSQSHSSFGRAFIDTTTYQQARFSITTICRENKCFVRYAEIRVPIGSAKN